MLYARSARSGPAGDRRGAGGRATRCRRGRGRGRSPRSLLPGARRDPRRPHRSVSLDIRSRWPHGVRSLIDLLPDEHIVYFGDTGRFPYGSKPRDEVLKYALEIGDMLIDEGARLIVVACNSAASAGLDTLRERLPVPVIGVIEPGIRAAVKAVTFLANRRHRDRRHDRVRRLPARCRLDAGWDRSCVRGRARASSSSSRPATSTLTRCTSWRNACWHPFGTPMSTPSCLVAPTTPCLPVRSAT